MDGINTVSGWAEGRNTSKEFRKNNEITEVPLYESFHIAEDMKYTFAENASIDNDMAGSAHACHAEKKIMVQQLGEPIGVSRDMREDCQSFAQSLANATNDPIVIASPNYLYIFRPDEDRKIIEI